jgi:hypothetical protein
MSPTDITEWRRSFIKASELFSDASDGQLQYGRIFVCDESVGADAAEIILRYMEVTMPPCNVLDRLAEALQSGSA